MTNEIYLDNNATTPVLPSACVAALHAMNALYGNPSSSHAAGLKARTLMEDVRARARRVLGAGDGRLMFNSGATEGIQTAIVSALLALRARRAAGEPCGKWLVVGATEHKAVPESLSHWNRVLDLGLDIKVLAVGRDGLHDLAQLRALAPEAGLVCTMAANNETGVISDLDAVAATLADTRSRAYWLVDCVQALGKLSLDLAATRIDYAPFSGHKLYAPKGVGMLYVRAGAPFTPLMVGGGQESGQRAGTENMAGIAALGDVLAAMEAGRLSHGREELAAMRERLLASLRAAFPGIVFNAPFTRTLQTTINFSLPWLASKDLLDVFDAAGVRVSSGSACSAAKAKPSEVLLAMGLPLWQAEAAVRLSFGPHASDGDIDAACARIAQCGRALRAGGLVPDWPAAETAPQIGDGPIRFHHEGANTWLIVDHANRNCALVDPQQALAGRIDSLVRALGYRLAATVFTDGAAADGAHVTDSVQLGAWTLSGTAVDNGNVVYVMHRDGQRARYAFIGRLGPVAVRHALIDERTLLLALRDDGGPLCTSLRAEREPPQAVSCALAPGQLAAFLDRHPDALLVDVRERCEQIAGHLTGTRPDARMVGVPLGELTGRLDEWLQTPSAPLLFLCRSGNRSARAASCLRRLGHASAWTLSGGLAAAEVPHQDKVSA